MNDLTIRKSADAETIRTRILTIRGVQVMLDRDLAELYGVPTRRLNEQVKRNMRRFPESFMFQLTKEELDNWRSQIAKTSGKLGIFVKEGGQTSPIPSAHVMRDILEVNVSIFPKFTKIGVLT